jgi:hypothetical protein
LPSNKKREGTNIVAAAVHIAGGPQRVAQALGVSRSQIYRWIAAGTMSHAIYIHVSALAKLSGIRTQFLGGEILSDSDSDSPDSQYAEGSIASKLSARSSKPTQLLVNPDRRLPLARLTHAGTKAALGSSVAHGKKNGFASIAIVNEPRGGRAKTEIKEYVK